MNQNKLVFSIKDLALLWQSTVGIEKESLRVTENNQIALTDHPRDWGDRSFHPYLQTDFSESQIELITPPESNSKDILNWLQALHQITYLRLNESDYVERLWPNSMPPSLDHLNKVRPAQLLNSQERHYREYLTDKYGKDVQLLSGIHYNFQINPQLMEQKLKESITTNSESDYIKSKNELYMAFMRKYLYYRWGLTYLLAASPYVDSRYQTKLHGKPHQTVMRSVRQSRYGYKNDDAVTISYQSLEAYIKSLESHVKSGRLLLEKELYRDVRMRGSHSVRDLLKEGISYLEFRNFDLNPFAPCGISQEDLDFIKIWIIALLMIDKDFSDQDLELADQRNQSTAEDHPLSNLRHADLLQSLLETLSSIGLELDRLNATSYYSELVQDKLIQINHPERTRAGFLYNKTPDYTSYQQFMSDIAQLNQKEFLHSPYLLHGFEDLELSTQDLCKKAIQLGLNVDWIDPKDQLLRLTYQDHHEFVRNANMTRFDSQVSYFIMDNKLATKKVLKEQGIFVPEGQIFDQQAQAKAYYPQVKSKPIVIKPKNTNYGIGITIFNQAYSEADYREAISEAFKYDQEILVENYIEGTEIRFYLLNHKFLAACERQPAQIYGDGIHTIDELIDLENQNPLRGKYHRAPMTLLEKGKLEKITLKEQGLDFSSIPQSGQKVYLRRNSNVSSGGIAIDRTDAIHQSYIDYAIQASRALEANFCGVDMIIRDYHHQPKQEGDYAIIEANYNPMASLHLFPGKGKSHDLSLHTLYFLFPELKA